MSDALPSLDQDIFQSCDDGLHIAVVLAGVHVHDVLVKMRVESRRINVQHFALARENGKDCLDTMKFFAITQIDILNQIIQHFDQILKELDVDDVREPKTVKNKLVSV